MPRRFEGWPESAFEVLLRLEGEPSPAVMRAVRHDREALVRQPMVALLDDLAWAHPAFEDHAVWRYAKTPGPWQTQSALVRIAPNVEISLRLNLDGLHLRGAWWYGSPDQIRRFRAAVAADPALTGVLADLRAQGYEITGDVMKRVPRDYPADHPRAALLRHRSLLAGRTLGADDWLRTPAAVDSVLAAHEELKPLLGWLTDHLR